ncbi:MAG: transglycosylase SLT domain-containing protein [Proteobacteria bacterium]|nr:transglycosylase SLT domain-containing protein [Pseudomonadota bacterium]
MDIAACPDLAVPAQIMRHVVAVESSTNPFAIGVVGNRLVRQPRNLDEAVATARMLEGRGYNFSVGASQVNRGNLRKYGLDDHSKAFDFCRNLAAGSRILAECYRSAQGHWGKAFSCYYSGNFVTGFRDGYVQKVYDSINRGTLVAQNQPPANAIALRNDSNGAAPVAPRTSAPPPSLAAARAGVPSGNTPFTPQVRQLAPGEAVQPAVGTTPAVQVPPPGSGQGNHDNAFVF